jgi:hypothetical protein
MCVCSGDTWLAECILDNSSPELTWLDLHTDEHSDHMLHRLQQLHNLHELTIHHFSFPDKCFANSLGHHADFSRLTVCASSSCYMSAGYPGITRRDCRQHSCCINAVAARLAPLIRMLTLQALTALLLKYSAPSSVISCQEEQTLSKSLLTLRELRFLTFEQLDGVSGDVMAAVLQVPKLEYLRFSDMQDWEWSATTIGLLCAKAAAQRPGLRITFDQPETAAAGPAD